MLAEGDYIKVTASKYPFPTVCAEERSVDWFQSISRTLRWNEREKQKSFVVVEEDRPKPVKGKAAKPAEDQSRNAPPTEDDIRVKASQKEAQDGQDSLAKKTSEEGTRQAKQRGEKAEDGDSEETSEDDEEEDEAFDIDEYVHSRRGCQSC
jgi:NAD+ kinase